MSNTFANFSNFPQSVGSNMAEPNRNSTIQQATLDYNPLIIKPPERNKTHGTITKHIVIDSRDRDYIKYPTSSKYRVEITEDLRDVTSIELSLAQIPNTFYNISAANTEVKSSINGNNTFFNPNGNNIFYIEESELSINSIEIPEGQYTNDLMIDTLNGKYGNLFSELQNSYNFVRDPINLKLRIQSNRNNGYDFNYNLNYATNNNCRPCQLNSIDISIGFLNKKYESEEIDLSEILVQKNGIIDLGKKSDDDYKLYEINKSNTDIDFKKIFYVGDYLILKDPFGTIKYSVKIYKINNSNTITVESLDDKDISVLEGFIFQNMSVLISPNIFQLNNKPYVILKISEAKLLNSVNASNNTYTIIPLLTQDNTIVNQATTPVHGVIKYFNPPVGKLFYMDVEFLNYDGSLFNFRGQENMLLFIISLLNQPGKYNNYVDTN